MPIGTGTLTEASETDTNIVNASIQNLNSTYLEYERRIHHLRKLRFMKLRTATPKAFQGVVAGGIRSPLSYRLVQSIVGMICKERPSFKRVPRSRNERDSASRLQGAADPLLQDLERIARRPLMNQAVDALVADGRSVVKCYRDVWGGFPDQLEGEMDDKYNARVAQFVISGASHPLRMKLIDNLNFKIPLTDYDPPYVMEGGKRPTLAVCEAYNLKFGTNNRLETLPQGTAFHTLELPSGIAPTIDVEEIWLDDRAYVRIGGKVFETPNDLGFKPYVWSIGETSSHPDPALNTLSVLYPLAGIEPWLNTMLTVLASWSIIGGTPILYTSRKLSPGGGNVPDVTPQLTEIPLGKRVDLGPGGEIGFVTPPSVGREVLEFINFLVDFMDRAGLPELAYGSIGTRTPGTAFQGALEQALSRVHPITNASEGLLADIVKMQWRIVENLGYPVHVTGIGMQGNFMRKRKELGRYVINPKDIDGYYDLHAKLKVGNTQDLVVKGTHADFMHKAGLWSRERAMEFSEVDDPFQEYKDIMANQMEQSPLVMNAMMSELMEQEPEIMQRALALQGQGVDIMAMLTGQSDGSPAGAQSGAGGGGGSGGGGMPAPRRGGRPSGSPKNPGGPRKAKQGSRGHS